jgi:signal transduction histidine kinase
MSYQLERPSGERIRIGTGRNEIGSGPGVDICIAEAGVAPRHAILFNVYGKLWVQTIAGTSITVNGRNQQVTTLTDGDQLRIGSTVLTVKPAVGNKEKPTLELDALEEPKPLIHTREQQMRGTGLMRQVESGVLSPGEMARYVMAFHRLTELIRSVTDRNAIISAVVELLCQLFGVKVAHYVEQREGHGIRVMGRGAGNTSVPSTNAPSHTLIRRVLEEQVSYLVCDPRPDSSSKPPGGGSGPGSMPGSDSMVAYGIQAAMAAPVPMGGDHTAALYVDTRDEWVSLGKQDLALLEAVASYLGFALEKAELYGDLDSRVKNATQELRKRAGELERRNAELKRIQSQREMLVSLLIHDIKGGLSSIRAGIELSTESLAKGKTGILGDSLDAVRQGALRIESMVGDMLDVSRLEDGALVPRRAPLPLSQLLEGIEKRWQPAAMSRRVQLQVSADKDTVILADVALLGRVLDNLVANALRFAPPNTVVELRAAIGADRTAHVAVVDHGEGIAQAERAKLFQKYGSVEGRPTGHGLGLYFCRLAVEAHGGAIEVTGKKGDNRVVFRIPAS